ncbi:hypothetical protein ACHAXN_001992 [Cyclotella atomus]
MPEVICTRRASIISVLTSSAVLLNPSGTSAQESTEKTFATPSLTIPLHYEPKLSAYIIEYTVGERRSKFGAIVDTGSPFLVVPRTDTCRPDYPWGCYRPEESREAVGLKPTRERFDGNEGWVEWREGLFSFLPEGSNTIINTELAASSLALLFPHSSSMTFGVISETLMDGPGGIFLGLVKNTDSWIRPSFLGQSQRSITPSLTLFGTPQEMMSTDSTKASYNYSASLGPSDYIPLTTELNKRYGDPTIHYVAVASSIKVNGFTLASSSRKDGRLFVIFDTGCSGMTISPDLFDDQYSLARSQRAKNVWDTVEVEFKTNSGETVTLNAKRPITTPLASDRPWGQKLDGHLIVLGLAFLDNLKMTIDADNSKIWFTE